MTDTGRVIEIKGPKIVREVLDDFPGYGLYQRGKLSLPLFEDEVLHVGQVYYLLPFGASNGNVESTMVPYSGSLILRKGERSSSGDGFWKVKMAIDSKELEEMLSQNAEDLIQMMRSAAQSTDKLPERKFGRRTFGFILGGRLTTC
ncbi:uncharacterized protein LOC141651840 [Silene latifolia]|uniref:uncharacterized protein LOC141651840 n=1 Tax=Silene latifolia TaxID=37657 RepID=UPI003D774EF0